MPDLREGIESAILGFGRGYGKGRSSELELRKELWKEKMKRKLFPEDTELKKAQIKSTDALTEQRRALGKDITPIITGYTESGEPIIQNYRKGIKKRLF